MSAPNLTKSGPHVFSDGSVAPHYWHWDAVHRYWTRFGDDVHYDAGEPESRGLTYVGPLTLSAYHAVALKTARQEGVRTALEAVSRLASDHTMDDAVYVIRALLPEEPALAELQSSTPDTAAWLPQNFSVEDVRQSTYRDLQLLRLAAENRPHGMNSHKQVEGLQRLMRQGLVHRAPSFWYVTGTGARVRSELEQALLRGELAEPAAVAETPK